MSGYYNNDLVIEQANEITRLTQQRDELLAALKGMVCLEEENLRERFEGWFARYHDEACEQYGGLDCTNPKGIAEDAWQEAERQMIERCAKVCEGERAGRVEARAHKNDAKDADCCF